MQNWQMMKMPLLRGHKLTINISHFLSISHFLEKLKKCRIIYLPFTSTVVFVCHGKLNKNVQYYQYIVRWFTTASNVYWFSRIYWFLIFEVLKRLKMKYCKKYFQTKPLFRKQRKTIYYNQNRFIQNIMYELKFHENIVSGILYK